MGTTLTLAYSLNDELFVAHVGDSRCYLCRRGILHRLTRDHTVVQELVEELIRRRILKASQTELDKGSTWVVEAEDGSPVGARYIPAP